LKTAPPRFLSAPLLAFEALPSQVNAGAPLDLLFAVFPAHPINQLIVERTSNGRQLPAVRGWPVGRDPTTGAQHFRVQLPALEPDEAAEYWPVVTRSGLVVETRPPRSTRGIRALMAPSAPDTGQSLPTAVPRYQWASEFLGAFTVQLIKPPESFGPGPDGMHITYYIQSGTINGPKINGKVRGGDWMLLRHDGVGVAESRITYETDDGALLLSRYYGIFDLGPDGYERALRNEFDPVPPLVLAPQFVTSHPNWLWLNRLQCLAVGRATMRDLIVRLDIYAIRTGQPLPSSGLPRADSPALIGDIYTPSLTPSSMSSPTAARAHSPKSNLHWSSDGTGPDPRPRDGMLPATRYRGMMQEAIRLAEDGELGNSDAIRLLQIPHRPEDVKEVLVRFEKQLTREAKSKLTLEAFAPLPDGVDNQRYEPIFDRYPITGKTYVTAAGAVVLNEIQYYNGEMVQLYGQCSNVAQVREALAGSGYKPLMMWHADGRESAIAQFWSHKLTDTSLRPYNAAFIIVAAVPTNTPANQACIAADDNGASSALAMLDGAFDSAKAVYENRVRLFYIRLLDSTQIAIDVGRERMGTDKRPGTILLTRDGKQRSFSVKDSAGNPVAKIDFVLADDPSAFHPEVVRAAATAGVQFRALPVGVEYVYPGVARIGTGPVINWQWRTDLVPRLQRVEPNTVTFDSRSEEGDILIRWSFEPKVLGYIPNVRGVITGVA
jgi:hypothetical protein